MRKAGTAHGFSWRSSACEANAKLGLIPARSLATIKKKADFDVRRIDELEKVVKHDVIAFLTAVGEHVRS